MIQLASRRRPRSGWIVVAVAGAAVLIGAEVRSAPGIFIAMEVDIGISRSAVSLAVSLVASLSINRNQRPLLLAAA